MTKKHWIYDKIDSERDYSLLQVSELTAITQPTLNNWRRSSRLRVYEDSTVTRGEWVIEAMRTHVHSFNQRARIQSAKAIKDGTLVPQPCEVCGRKPEKVNGRNVIHGHHDDYSKPLEVRWLCIKHHGEAHKDNPRFVKRTPNIGEKAISLVLTKELYDKITEVSHRKYQGNKSMFIRKLLKDYFLKYPEKGIEESK